MEHRVIGAYQWQIGHFRTYQFIANGAQSNWSISMAYEMFRSISTIYGTFRNISTVDETFQSISITNTVQKLKRRL